MTNSGHELAALFLNFSRKALFEQSWPRLKECVAPLTDEQVWWRPNQASNSIGNLLLHLDGNVRQWLVTRLTEMRTSATVRLSSPRKTAILAAELLHRFGSRSMKPAKVLDRLTVDELLYSTRFRAITCAASMPSTRSVAHFTALRPDCVYHEKSARQGSRLL